MGESPDGLNTYPLKVFRSTSVVPLSGYVGYNVGYERVEENTNGNGIKIHEYYTPAYSPSSLTNFPQMYPQDGKLKSINSFNENGTLVARQEMFGTSNLSTSNIPILKAKRYEVDCSDNWYDIYSYYSQTYNIRGGYFQNSLTISTIDDVTTTTSYEYDQVNRKVKETYPDHTAGTSLGDAGYGIREFAYDAIGRLLRSTDQLGETVTHLYDLAGRRTNREYRTLANSPSGTVSDEDTFTYDDGGRIASEK